MHLVEQRVAEPRHLGPRPRVDIVARSALVDPGLLAAGRGPDAEHRVGVGDLVGLGPVHRQLADGHLDGDAVHVEPGGGVHPLGHLAEAGAGQAEGGVVLLEGAEVAEVEHGAEVDVEALGPLAGEHLGGRAQRGEGLGGEGRVVGCRERPDVAGRAGDPRPEETGSAPVHPGHRVGLPAVPARAAQRLDRTGVVQERVGIGDLARELELVADVGVAVVVVVDVDGIEDVLAELVEVGPAVGRLERDVVGDDGDMVGLVGADERVEVGRVGDGVLGDLGRFTVR